MIAKLLEIAGRTDIPVGIGVKPDDLPCNLTNWIKDYALDHYPGIVYPDAADAVVKTIMESDEKVTLICIGPLPNIGEALRREPKIVEKARFIGAHGSFYKGYGGSDGPIAETNSRLHTSDCQQVFRADWNITITPIDTCGDVDLAGADYQQILQSEKPLLKALQEKIRIFAENCPWLGSDYDYKMKSRISDL